MQEAYIYFTLVVFGLVFGSYAGATVWRLRSRQLVEDKAEGYEVDEAELKLLKKLNSKNIKSDRSVCLQCGHELKWYDLIPLLSWLSTGGRCRYCKKPIGRFEPAIELGVAALFVLSFALWPFEFSSVIEVVKFVLWLMGGIGLAILFAYDAKWLLLPNTVMWSTIGIAAIYATLVVLESGDVLGSLVSLVGSVFILSGLYFLLYLYSSYRNGEDGSWVGFGDVKLGLALALFLTDWRLALLALFLANLIGSLVVIPGMVLGKVGRKSQVPFGPLMIAGAVIAMLVGERVIDIYLGAVF